jgi:hypothetical protein
MSTKKSYENEAVYDGIQMVEQIEPTEEVASPRMGRIVPMVAPRYDDVPTQAG